MTPRSSKKTYPLIPEEERKCVWMTTGFLSYKLCDRDYQCEICPFDQAIKNEGDGEYASGDPEEDWRDEPADDPSARIPGSVFYHPDHCWAKVEEPEQVRIGIDDLLTQLITDVRVVILPQIGSVTVRGECCAHIIQEDYILPVIAPLSGSIQTVNPRLQKEPELIIHDPGEHGWLLTIKPRNLESDLKNLLFGRKALLWHHREEKEIIARADFILKRNPEAIGPTLQDGGVRIRDLRHILGSINARQKIRILDSSITRSRASMRSALKPPEK